MNEKNYTKIDYRAVGERLRQLRGFESQGDFGKRFNKPYLYIGRIERGDVRPSAEFLYNLCLEYGVSFEWLMTGEGPKERAVGEPACDTGFLQEVIVGVEEFLREEKKDLPPEDKAELITTLFSEVQKGQEEEEEGAKNRILRLTRLMARLAG